MEYSVKCWWTLLVQEVIPGPLCPVLDIKPKALGLVLEVTYGSVSDSGSHIWNTVAGLEVTLRKLCPVLKITSPDG